MTDIVTFLGRFHPLVVHLPIGILLFALLLEGIGVFYPKKGLKMTVIIALWAGGISGLIASGLGYLLSLSGGYEDSTLFWHKYLGIGTSLGAFILLLLAYKPKWNYQIGRLHLNQGLLVLLVIALSITGHLGGNLTHGDSYLTEHMPNTLKKVFGVNETISDSKIEFPLSIDSVVVYDHLIAPMLKSKCVSCHNSSKKQGDLDLTTIEGIQKGGLSGLAIEGGKVDKSELVKRIILPKESKKFMPPNNLTSLTAVEVSIIKWWVKNGANFEKSIHDFKAEEKVKYLFATYLGMEQSDKKRTLNLPLVAPADSVILQQLDQLGIKTRMLSEKSYLLDVSFSEARKSSEVERKKQFDLLSKIALNVYKLDANSCSLDNTYLPVISAMKNLTYLRLEKNVITDEGIAQLKGLTKLEYLNMYNNPLTNQSVEQLMKMNNLKKLYLWQTKLDTVAIEKIQATLSGTEIIF